MLPRRRLDALAALVLLASACAGPAQSILAPSESNKPASATKEQPQAAAATTTTTTTASPDPGRLDAANSSSSVFHYEPDAFLLNKQPGLRSRAGRMLDLDALVGDLAASRAQHEARAQLGTSRQSRNLALADADLAPRSAAHQLDIGGGKRLHIQGFIPIVGVKDADEPEEQPDGGPAAAQPHVSQLRQQQPPQSHRPKMVTSPAVGQLQALSNELPYGQSSIGHATFNVQRYLNTELAPVGDGLRRQFVQLPPFQQPQQAQQVEPKFSDGGLVGTLKRPIKRFTNTFGGSNSDSAQTARQQQQQQQQNCLCVPFYMCKGGQLSESGLGRAQIQQMIVQQQQQQQQTPTQAHLLQVGQQPRQLAAGPAGSVESVAAGDSGAASYANSAVPVDERSLEREIVTAPPPPPAPAELESQLAPLTGLTTGLEGAPNQTSGAVEQQQQQQQDQRAPAYGKAPDAAAEAAPPAQANGSLSHPDEMTTLDQTSDYSQEILGRMLGLKSGQQEGAGERASAGGACGLLRTCCTIPAHLLPPQQQAMALQRYQQQQQQQQQSVVGPAAQFQPQAQFLQAQSQLQPQFLPQQVARAQPSAMAHRSSSALAHAALGLAPARSVNAPQAAVQQYSRASQPQQALQSFQAPAGALQSHLQQQQQQQQQQLVRPPAPAPAHSPAQLPAQSAAPLGTRKLLEGRCGLRQSAGINGRVQNLAYQENAAEFGEYPAQAAILKRLNGSESLFVCGGTLVSQSWVATAAHCIRKHLGAGEQLKVRLGEWDVHRDDEFYPFVEREVRDLVVHPEFVPGNLINDLALLRLDAPLDPTLPHVNPACLPALDESFARQRCWVTGWGKDAFGARGSFQAVLQEVELPVLGHAECEQQLRSTRLGPHYRLHPGFLCAGGENGRDACEGDGGSGLYCTGDGLVRVAGLVSWGIGCGQAGVPGVYVNVAHYRPWIENIIAIDEDIYSAYGPLPLGAAGASGGVNGGAALISERSRGSAAANESALAPTGDQDSSSSGGQLKLQQQQQQLDGRANSTTAS